MSPKVTVIGVGGPTTSARPRACLGYSALRTPDEQPVSMANGQTFDVNLQLYEAGKPVSAIVTMWAEPALLASLGPHPTFPTDSSWKRGVVGGSGTFRLYASIDLAPNDLWISAPVKITAALPEHTANLFERALTRLADFMGRPPRVSSRGGSYITFRQIHRVTNRA